MTGTGDFSGGSRGKGSTMGRLLRHFAGGRAETAEGAPFPPLPRPVRPICVIGDVHGCADALERLLKTIAAEPLAGLTRLVFVGDLVDRGPDSARVLALVRAMTERAPGRVTALMGNHERMMLDALETPSAMAAWLSHGGADTVASFGLSPHGQGSGRKARLTHLAGQLRDALPPGLTDWLAARPLYWRDDDLAVTHAVGDPALPLETQDEKPLIWGHAKSLSRIRGDGLWVAHGHWIQPDVSCAEGRIGCDTGAYRGGRLSAAWIGPDGFRVISVPSEG